MEQHITFLTDAIEACVIKVTILLPSGVSLPISEVQQFWLENILTSVDTKFLGKSTSHRHVVDFISSSGLEDLQVSILLTLFIGSIFKQ